MTPTEWFDSLPTEGIGENGQWCARHWAPCPVFGANGMGALVELISAFIATIEPGASPEQMNANMKEVGRLCCYLGDDKMYDIWGHWPPELSPEMN